MDYKKYSIKQLVKAHDYDEIYRLFGRNDYLKNVSFSHRLKDIKKLIKNGNFTAIYEKYGEEEYQKHLDIMYKVTVENELGRTLEATKINVGYKATKLLKKGYTLMTRTAIVGVTCMSTLTMSSNTMINDNKNKYQNEIEDYNQKIETYAKSINSLGLNDLEVIVKVVNDMWNEMEGYGTPEKDIYGYWRLDLTDDNAIGVCRNMADDVAAKLNAINPDYKAANLNVCLDGTWGQADIKRNVVPTNDNEIVPEENEIFNKIFGNHMVTTAYLKSENVVIVIDPTNPSIVVLKNGKIYLLSDYINGSLEVRPFATLLTGGENILNIYGKYLQSFVTNPNIEELNCKYNTEAQNKALENIHKMK